ncbi:MAG TPA: hypothetical protein VGF92_10925 [Stellaceae bacterium]
MPRRAASTFTTAAETGRLCRVIDRRTGRESRHRDTQGLGEFGDDRHVFLPNIDLHRRRVIACGHQGCAQLENARISGTRGDHLDDSLGIQPGFHAEHHCFGTGDVVHRDQQIGDEFHLAAVAEGTEIVRRAGEAVEHRLGAHVGRALAAGVDREIARQGLRAGARKRTIEQRDAAAGKHRARFLFGFDRQGAELGDDEARGLRGEQVRDGFLEGLDARQARQHDIRALRRRARRCRRYASRL